MRQIQLDRDFSTTVWTLFGYGLITLLRSLPLLMVWGVYLLLDDMIGISQRPKAVLVIWLVSLPCTFLIVCEHSRATRYAVQAGILVLLLAVSHVNWNSRTPIFRAFYAIEPGMTIEQVERLMDSALSSATAGMAPVKAWDPRIVPPAYFDLPRTGPVTNVDTLRYHPWECADIFYVYFVDGRVIERHFSPD